MARKLVMIVKDKQGNYLVYPGKRHVKKGDKILFETVDSDATVSFPNQKPFGNTGKFKLKSHGNNVRGFHVTLDPKGKALNITYKVDCNGQPAQGGSDPEMIIDP